MALLTEDEKLFKELDVTDQTGDYKKLYVSEQIDSIRALLWRSRVDLIINNNVETTSEEQVEALKTKGLELVRNIKQTSKALKVLEALDAELN